MSSEKLLAQEKLTELNIKGDYHFLFDENSPSLKNRWYLNSNGERVNATRKEVKKRIKDWKLFKENQPILLNLYDTNELLIERFITYYDCLVGFHEIYYSNGNLKEIRNYKKMLGDSIYECETKDGMFTYFDADGDTLYSEEWNDGVFVKQEPELKDNEIWKVKLLVNGKEPNQVDSSFSATLLKLEFRPIYKNRGENKLTYEVKIFDYTDGSKMVYNKKHFADEQYSYSFNEKVKGKPVTISFFDHEGNFINNYHLYP